MGYIGVITHLLTIDPNFQRDLQVNHPSGFAPLDILDTLGPVEIPHSRGTCPSKGGGVNLQGSKKPSLLMGR